MNISRKRYNHEAQPSPGTKTRIDEEHTMTKETQHTKPPTHEQIRTATKEPPWKGQKKKKTTGTLIQFYSTETSP